MSFPQAHLYKKSQHRYEARPEKGSNEATAFVRLAKASLKSPRGAGNPPSSGRTQGMLEIISKGFQNAKTLLSGKTTLSEENIKEAVREIRVSLLEADVEIGVVRSFIKRVKDRALGEVVALDTKTKQEKLKTSPGDHFVLICQHELERLMGPQEDTPIVYHRPATIIMMVGLQGTGKTTTTGKLAKYLLNQGKKPLLVAADIYRPAAVKQLQVLGSTLGVPVYAEEGVPPPELCSDALKAAKKQKCNVIIFDTAGRLAIDDVLMQELEDIKEKTCPHQILLVCDAMAGQNTVQTASEFNRRLDLTGFIMTKLDGDARGGAALSIKEVTGKPVKFLGMGEGLDKLEPFRPEGLASRILGMGDILSLMHDFEQVIDEKQAERDTKKMLKGQFTLDDFLSQLRSIQQVGSLSEIYEKFPIFGDNAPKDFKIDDSTLGVMESIIQSMTAAERNKPALIESSRAKRIAKGSGRKSEQVMDLVQRFQMMHQMMAGLASQPGLLGNLPGIKQLKQLRQFKGKGLEDLFGKGGGMPDLGKMGLPQGMPPQMGGPGGMMAPAGMPGGLPPGVSMEDYQKAMMAYQGNQKPGGPARSERNTKQKQKAKDKRKAARKARKKGRKR